MTLDPLIFAASLGIPVVLLPTVARRHRETARAVIKLTGYRPLGAGADLLTRRVVARAVEDHARGVLERVRGMTRRGGRFLAGTPCAL